MPLPKGLHFQDRIAEHDTGYFFQCRRADHARVRLGPLLTRRDAENLRADHDHQYHLGVLKFRMKGERAPKITLGTAFKNYLDDLRELAAEGRRDPKTIAYYKSLERYLLNEQPPHVSGFGKHTPLLEIDQPAVERYVKWRKVISETEGDRIVKDLKALKTIASFALRVPLPIRIPYDRIRPKQRPKRRLDYETIRRFIDAMPEGSVERGYTTLKILTGMRNVELAAIRVRDIDFERKVLHYTLRSKMRAGREHVYPLTDFAIRTLTALVRSKRQGDLLFTIEGRPLLDASLRRRFQRASRKAGIDPPIESIGEFRSMALTKIAHALGPYAAQKAVGHKSVTTSEIYIRRESEPDEETKRAARELESIFGDTPLS